MPREQGHFREGIPHSTSKVAKDKSNTSTLQAAHGGKSDLRKHMLRRASERDSEKDSGYSEAGSDDQRSSRSKLVREKGKNLNSNPENAAGASRSLHGELPPVYVIKDLLVKPSTPEQLLHGPLAWSGGWHSLATAKPQTGLLLLRHPAISAPLSSTPTSSSCLSSPLNKGSSCNKQNHSKNSYLPILNAYPRIAPHPRKDSHEVKGTTWAKEAKESRGEGHSPSKRVCIEEEKWDAVSTTSDLHRTRQHPSHSGEPVFSNSTQQQSSGHDSVCSPSVSSSQTPSPPSLSESPSSSSPPSSSLSSSTAHSPYHSALDGSNTRQRRFLNTTEILNQSGLLAVTLRTKELLKQNTAADRELAQLRQHTQLLCQAAQAGQRWGNKGSDSLDKLLQAMKESGSYPGLDVERLKTLSSTRNQEDCHRRTTTVHCSSLSVVSLHNVDDGTSPPSPLFAPSPDPTEHLLCFLPEAPT